MSVRIEPSQVGDVVARRPYAYVVTASGVDGPHLRAVVPARTEEGFVLRVGSRTSDNVRQTGTVTLVWPPLSGPECREQFDDHRVIVDCSAQCREGNDSFEVTATPLTAVWHRPAR